MGTLIFNVALLVLKQFLLGKERDNKYEESFNEFLKTYSKTMAKRSADGKARWIELLTKK